MFMLLVRQCFAHPHFNLFPRNLQHVRHERRRDIGKAGVRSAKGHEQPSDWSSLSKARLQSFGSGRHFRSL
jgi:hypothetical protein